jgi:hypothetical protein
LALVQASQEQVEKPAKVKKVKTPKAPVGPQYLSKDLNPRGKQLLRPELVEKVFADYAAGMKRPQSAEKYNISQGSVSTILNPPSWFSNRMIKYAAPGWKYPTRAEKTSEKKAE